MFLEYEAAVVLVFCKCIGTWRGYTAGVYVSVGMVADVPWLYPRYFKISLGLYSKKFQKCLINYLGLSYEQTVTSQLYLLVNHHRDHSSLLQSLWYS
jgi:hypothetical protein